MKKTSIIKKILLLIGFISLAFIIMFLGFVLIMINSMSSKKVRNPDIKSLVNDMKQMDTVQEIEAYQRGFDIYIDIYIDETFTIEESYKILDLAKKHITVETKNELIKEFKSSEPLDININFRNAPDIIKNFCGTCYARDSSRSDPPDYEQYVWE